MIGDTTKMTAFVNVKTNISASFLRLWSRTDTVPGYEYSKGY